MAANQTTITVSTRIGADKNTIVTGFTLPAPSVEEMLLLSAAQITEQLNAKGAGIFKPINGLGVLPHFRVEDGTHRLFANERRGKVGATFGGAVENKDAPIIEQIAAELEEESFGQFRFVRDNAGEFHRNAKGQFIILCKQRTTTRGEDGSLSHEYVEKELALTFNAVTNHFVDNRKSAIDPKTNKPIGFNMSFLTVQAEINGLTEKELSMLAKDKTPTAKLWNSIYGELAALKWNAPEEKRNAAKERIKELYTGLQQQHGAFLVEPATVFQTENVDQALGIIFGDISTEEEYKRILNGKVGSYSESPASTIVTSTALKALATVGEGALEDIESKVITDANGKPAAGGFIGYAMKGLEFPQPYAAHADEKKATLHDNRYGKFSTPRSSSPELEVAAAATRAPSPGKTR